MKTLISAALCSLVLALFASTEANAQWPITTYYAPSPVATGYYPHATAYYGATTSYYAPTAVGARTAYYPAAPRAYAYYPSTAHSYSRPVTTYYAPVATYPPTTTYYAPAAVGFYSPYGGPEVRVPGQPVRNAIRTIVP